MEGVQQSFENFVNDTQNPLSILVNLLALYFARDAIPSVPQNWRWVVNSFPMQVLFLAIFIYKHNLVRDNLQMAVVIALGTVVIGNLINNQPLFGTMSIGTQKVW